MRLAALLMVALSSCAAAAGEREVVRAYLPVVDAQQSADRLVRDEDELRQALWDAINPNRRGSRPSTIRLGANITLSRPIQLSGKYDVTIEGGGRYSIGIKKRALVPGGFIAYPYFESDNGFSDFTVRGVSFLENIGRSGVEPLHGVFGVSAAAERLVIDNCTYDPSPFVVSSWVMSLSGSSFLDNVFISTPSRTGLSPFSGSAPSWTGYLRTSEYHQWVTSSVSGQTNTFYISSNSLLADFYGSGSLTFRHIDADFHSLSIGKNGIGVFAPLYSVAVGGALSGSDPEIDFRQSDFKPITLDATTSGDIHIKDPAINGRVLELLFVANNGTAKLTDGVGRFSGNGDFTPVAGSTIRLRSYGGTWYEMARTP